MTYVTLEFSGIKSIWELHEYFKNTFDLPDYYGRNLDALWDCLRCSFAENTTIILKNIYSLPKEMHPMIPDIQKLFRDLENEEAEVTVKYVEAENTNITDFLI